METPLSLITAAPDCQIITSRIFNHPCSLIFSAWTNPDRLKNWWGPNGFTNTIHEFDLRPGGKWSFVMHGPDGNDYPNESIFVQIEEPGLLVFNHISGHEFQVVATFEEIKDHQTRVTFRMIFDTVEECNRIKVFAVDKNEENFDRLEMELQRDDFFYV
jgi:uncharacterized protein YndB with AHSA1/START domain